jgi:hypothetical protein
MKRCPACGSTYTDDSLRFCLQDGATLQRASAATPDFNHPETLRDDAPTGKSEPPPTEQLNLGSAPTEKLNLGSAPTVQGYAASPTVPVRSHPSTRATSDDSPPVKKSNPVVIVAATAAVVLLLVLTGFGLVYLLRDKTSGSANTAPASNANTQSANYANANANGSTATANASNANANSVNANARQSNTETRPTAPVQITATASSTLPPEKGNTYVASNVLDGSLLTAWAEGSSGPGVGEWIRCDFSREVKLRRILITPGYFKTTALWSQNNRLAAATFYFSDGTSRRFTFPDRMQEQRLDTGSVRTRWARMVIEDTYPGSVDSEDTPISQMTFDYEE